MRCFMGEGDDHADRGYKKIQVRVYAEQEWSWAAARTNLIRKAQQRLTYTWCSSWDCTLKARQRTVMKGSQPEKMPSYMT